MQIPEELKVVLYPIEFAAKHKKEQHSEGHLIKYPSNMKGGKHLHASSFSPVLFSSNVVKVCHSGGNDTKTYLQLDGVPDKLILTFAFIEVLCLEDSVTLFTALHLTEALDMIANFILRFDLSPWIKTSLFQTTASLIEAMNKRGIKFQSIASEKLLEKLANITKH